MRSELGPTAALIPLSKARAGEWYQVVSVLRPAGQQFDTAKYNHAWNNTNLRLSELGIFPGQVIVKSGSAGPGCPTILKIGGSRAAVSLDLSNLIFVKCCDRCQLHSIS